MMRTCTGTLVSGASCTISRNPLSGKDLLSGFRVSLLYRRLSASWYGCTCLLNRYGAQAPDMMRTCTGTLISGASCTISRNVAEWNGLPCGFCGRCFIGVSPRVGTDAPVYPTAMVHRHLI
ncbi:MAG: hypothetical protein IJI14_16330 [Anaerolineaceae bacterium]|nr:hypothetical protein [Anaerolineaceae bacterium]